MVSDGVRDTESSKRRRREGVRERRRIQVRSSKAGRRQSVLPRKLYLFTRCSLLRVFPRLSSLPASSP